MREVHVSCIYKERWFYTAGKARRRSSHERNGIDGERLVGCSKRTIFPSLFIKRKLILSPFECNTKAKIKERTDENHQGLSNLGDFSPYTGSSL
jgi:hypothetical protein